MPVDRSTFHVHAKEHGNFAKLAAIAQQSMGLARRSDIAHEKDDARGLQFAQHLAQRRRDRGAIEAHDQQLTDLLAKFEQTLHAGKLIVPFDPFCGRAGEVLAAAGDIMELQLQALLSTTLSSTLAASSALSVAVSSTS